MKIKMTIEFDLDNAAFFDEAGQPDVGPELSRIMHEVADKMLTHVPKDVRLLDINGNVCGRIKTVAKRAA